MASAAKKPAVKKLTSDDRAKFVKDLADILDKAGLAELEYKTEALAIRLSRLNGAVPIPAVQPVAPAAAASMPARVGEPPAEARENPADHPGTVKSPMVGTVYTLQNQTHPPLSLRETASARARPFLLSRQ